MTALNAPAAFGDISYPIKLYQAMACGRAVVASRTASTAWILRDIPDRPVAPRNPQALADRLVRALDERQVDYGTLPTWQEGGAALDAALRAAR